MPIEVSQFRFALLTADVHSFARAAAILNIKQATMSGRDIPLEDRLGARLDERTTGGAEPAATGSAFLEIARRIVADIDHLKTTARAGNCGEQGRLALGFSTSLLSGHLHCLIADFLIRLPDVQFDGIETAPKQLRKGLHDRTIDVAILPAAPAEPGLRGQPLWTERIMVGVGRFITIVIEAMLGVTWPDLSFRDIHDPGRHAQVDYTLFWREDNENPALRRLFDLVAERHPAFCRQRGPHERISA